MKSEQRQHNRSYRTHVDINKAFFIYSPFFPRFRIFRRVLRTIVMLGIQLAHFSSSISLIHTHTSFVFSITFRYFIFSGAESKSGGELLYSFPNSFFFFLLCATFDEHFHGVGKLCTQCWRLRVTCAIFNDAIKCRKDSGASLLNKWMPNRTTPC